LFIAADARNVSTDTIARVAKRLLVSGLIYVCVWGPNCKRVHDIFDDIRAGDGSIESSFTLMSTWHSDEPLEEALWFFIECAFPLDTEMATTSHLAITVGSSDWAASVRHALSDLAAFKARMVDDEPPFDRKLLTKRAANPAWASRLPSWRPSLLRRSSERRRMGRAAELGSLGARTIFPAALKIEK
jgi:hypothetical protein